LYDLKNKVREVKTREIKKKQGGAIPLQTRSGIVRGELIA